MNAREKGEGMNDFHIILTIFTQFILFQFVAIKNSYLKMHMLIEICTWPNFLF